jgi:tetratricopeptide (TPR) repeat protein
VEDLHWIDPSSDELIGLLLERLQGLPILAVLTVRPEFQSHWDDNPDLVRMPLAPLERSDSVAMIELLCGDKNIAAPTVSQIADKTDGLPLFIEDLTREVLEVAGLQEGSAARPDSPLPIPTTLTDSLMSRLDRLGSAKTVAQVGAAIGREFSYELLARTASIREDTLKEELSRLLGSGLLVRRRATMVLTYAFKHALVRDAAYSSLLKKDQVSLHARIAAVLAESFPDTAEAQPELLAHHFECAKDVDNAVRYLVKAAELSARRSGFVEAITQLQQALALLATKDESESRSRQELEVYLALGGINAEYRGFSASECGAAYNAALELCRKLGDAPEIFPVLSGVGSYEITRANFPKCRELAKECLSRAGQQSASPPFVIGYRLLGGTLFLTGEFTAAREPLEEAVTLYERDEGYWSRRVFFAQDQKSTVLCYLALTLTILGHCNEGLEAAEKGLRHSQSIGDLHTVNFSLCYIAAARYIAGDSQGSLRRATESLNLAREQGFATWIGISQIIRGASLVSNGACEEGLAEIARGVKGHSGIAAAAYQTYGVSLYVKGLIAAGRPDEALVALAQAFAISERTGERFYLSELWRLKAEALALKGHASAAEEDLEHAIAIARQQQARLFELRSTLALCKLLEGPRRQAVLRERLAPVHEWFDPNTDVPDLHAARALLSEA